MVAFQEAFQPPCWIRPSTTPVDSRAVSGKRSQGFSQKKNTSSCLATRFWHLTNTGDLWRLITSFFFCLLNNVIVWFFLFLTNALFLIFVCVCMNTCMWKSEDELPRTSCRGQFPPAMWVLGGHQVWLQVSLLTELSNHTLFLYMCVCVSV